MQATSPPLANQPTPSRHGRGSIPPRRNTSKYCWTHGACSHESSDCNAKAQWHQDSATFSNKMGGSTYYCQPVTDARRCGMNNAPTSEWKIVKAKSIKKGNSINALQLPPKSQTIIAKGNSAASNHYWALRDSMVLDDVEVDPISPTVILPDTPSRSDRFDRYSS